MMLHLVVKQYLSQEVPSARFALHNMKLYFQPLKSIMRFKFELVVLVFAPESKYACPGTPNSLTFTTGVFSPIHSPKVLKLILICELSLTFLLQF